MNDLLGALLRPVPACMGCGAPATVDDDPFSLCDSCEASLVDSLRQSGFPDPVASGGSSSPDVNVTAAAGFAPASGPAAVTHNSDPVHPSRAPQTGDASASSSLLNFETEVSALEAEWARAGIVMNSTTLRVTQDSLIHASAASSSDILSSL